MSTPHTAATERRRDTTRWLLGSARGLLTPLLSAAAARIVSQLLGVALLVLTAGALASAAGGADGVHVGQLSATLVVIALAKAALRYAEHYAGHWVAFTALQRLRELFFSSLVPQAPAATKGRAGAALTETATRDIDRIEVFFAHTFPPAVSAVATPAVALVWLGVAVDAGLALLLAPFVCAVLLLPLVSARTVWNAARRVAERRGTVAARIGDDVHGTRDVLMLGAQERRLADLDADGATLTEARSASGAVQGARLGAIDLVQACSLIAVVVFGLHTGAGVHAVVLALAVAIGLRGPARGVDSFTAGLDAALASAQRLRAIVEAPPVVTDPDSDVGSMTTVTADDVPGPSEASEQDEQSWTNGEAPRGGVEVAFREVSFTYPGTDTAADAGAARPRRALTGVSVTFPAGEWSCVVGVSGSGKSSLASLLLRAWDPDDGLVVCGGTPVAALPLDALRSRVALVDQRPTLLVDTVGANLRLANPDATDAEVDDALRVVGLDAWATSLPEGLDTVLTSGRTQVSGGQLQRLALARALLAEPDVLVLDEALSQLDEQTADDVRGALLDQRPGRTTLEITHRVDRVPDGAFVAVIDAGRLVERGRAGDLRARGGAFSRLDSR
ncbi:amino acid ABC transporter ATP-binding/permease protein [Brevibacterium yomogidense]|uniref:amino acid ABC transporter ATP-binding/permease protein n=1 Tax=Brevibacterium yomogidense TaxID=946573 RepID=UPI0018E02564